MNIVEIAKLIADYLTPILVAFFGFLFSFRLKGIDQQNQRRNQIYQEEKAQQQAEIERKEKQRREELERRYKPHIEFTIDANFYGPQQGFYIAEFVIYADNKSLIRHEFTDISFRVRGVKKEQQPFLWKGQEPRLCFPEKLFETNLKPKGWNFMFVEPGVKQAFTFATRVEDSFFCLIARAEFHYDNPTPHSIERVFHVDQKENGHAPTT